MKIELKRLDDAYHMQAINEDGATIETDGAPAIGGHNKGFRPMQLLIAAVGSCSSIDIISILKKQKQPIDDIQVSLEADREEGKVPSLFTNIRIHYKLFGQIDEKKAERAVELSMTKYCSVSKILEKTAQIDYSFEVIK